MLDAALRLADLGYPVFPCVVGDKKPACTHGVLDATTDAGQIAAWWEATPQANIGLSTNGLLVVDLDPGNAWLAGEPDRRVELAAAPCSLTPRGGKHYIFGQPAGLGLRNTAGKLAPHVDTRADGGYILVPPSVVNGKAYQWAENAALDCEPEKLPLPPGWLLSLLTGTPGSSADTRLAGPQASNAIPSGSRNAALASHAGSMRRRGMSSAEIYAALSQMNRDRCKPPLPDDEVRRTVESVARYEPDQLSTALAENLAAEASSEVNYKFLSAAELVANDFKEEYLIGGALVARQPCILAGSKKCLKTSILLDLGISLASGKPFLGQLVVNRPCRVAIMTGESGMATIKATAMRIAKSKEIELAAVENILFSADLPRFGDARHIEAVDRVLGERKIEVLAIDPAYLSMPGADAGNLFLQGDLLRSIGQVCERHGTCLIVCHHTKRKDSRSKYEAPELDDISWAGFQEWARQWILVGRREGYRPGSGEHKLWLSFGGSAGHSSAWSLDVNEGAPEDRAWSVVLMSDEELMKAARKVADETRAKEHAEKLAQDAEVVIALLRARPECTDTKQGLRDHLGWTAQRISSAISELINRKAISHATINKKGRDLDAFALAS